MTSTTTHPAHETVTVDQLRAELAALRSDMDRADASLRHELTRELSGAKHELRAEAMTARTDLQTRISDARREMSTSLSDQMWWTTLAVLVVSGALAFMLLMAVAAMSKGSPGS